ncbi:endonuclease V [Vitiosangium sp. GDMCC 1.1324]|uniref:endonuclease V n=1 Tax=Vitiosangium sp. (strain GDMCC 1.1324) TaxID=2138576 RepID=UPI000D34D98A|nr:endonuclease V [Vitiosangium sp. GDMCC 1.1324]PTL84574.1 endonuclease V [Vitiosangium sp. GDMCC 1.1324]
MELEPLHRWDLSPKQAVALQRELRGRLVLRPPPGLKVERVAGADISMGRGDVTAYGGFVVLDAGTLAPVAQASAAVSLTFPYVPGLLSFRELPVLSEAWARLDVRPDVLIFDGQGTAHPRRFGLACHGGLLFGVPSIGCAKSLLVGRHGPLGAERGSVVDILDEGEVIGRAVRTRRNVLPVYVSPGHLMDLPTAVALVLRMTSRYREPETTRHAHRLVNDVRRSARRA